MTLRPLGENVLIKPIANETETDSGLVLVEHRKPETMGTVIAVGPCEHPRRDEAAACADAVYEAIDSYGFESDTPRGQQLEETVRLLRELTASSPLVKAGDTVIFPWTAGREVTIDDGDDRYLLMRESDILAVLE